LEGRSGKKRRTRWAGFWNGKFKDYGGVSQSIGRKTKKTIFLKEKGEGRSWGGVLERGALQLRGEMTGGETSNGGDGGGKIGGGRQKGGGGHG